MTWVRWIATHVGARDLFVFGGLVLLCVGAGLVYLPAAYIIAGLALMAIGIYGVPQWR